MRALWLCTGLTLVLTGPVSFAGTPPADTRPGQAKIYQIPYTLSLTKHILVRAKINGKGPFNFIMDTGAPFLFVSRKVCRKIGVQADRKGWGNFHRFEVEGGAVVTDIKGRIDDPYQLEGMNGLALAGVELHGIIGYNLLARYRLEIDFTKDQMTWRDIDFVPRPPPGLGEQIGSSGPTEMNALGGVMKVVGALLGRKPNSEVKLRGFLGLQLRDEKGLPTVEAVLGKGPAEQAGVRPGDRIERFQGEKTPSLADLVRRAAKITPGQMVRLTIVRGGKTQEIAITVGEGL